MKKSLFGLDENIVSTIAYAGIWITGIIVFLLERENKTVRFHALQSTILFGGLSILGAVCNFVLGWIPLIGGLVGLILWAVPLFAWLFLMLAAFRGQMFKVPVLGDAVWAQVNK
ncbi:MAG: hypothetical protein LBS19_14535 [Clostridiales bacterium]|jgi:uncharacterized membrane protein|nr:hypothetical protein [Clostridiales bacterium]